MRQTTASGGEIFVADGDGSNATQITATDGGMVYGLPVFSPDGSTLSFPGGKPDEAGWSIFVANADGTDLHAITSPGELTDYAPTFSPDGTRIAFVRERDTTLQDPNGTVVSQIMAADLDGSHVQPVTPLGHAEDTGPQWLPDGRRILFQRWHPKQGIYLVTAEGATPRRVAKVNPGYDGFDVSSDGRRLLYEDDHENIVIQDLVRKSSTSVGHGTSPRWSPDGAQIAYEAADEHHDQRDAWVMKTDGSGARVLAAPGGAPAWSPDGTDVVVYETSLGPGIAQFDAADGQGHLLTNPEHGAVDLGLVWTL